MAEVTALAEERAAQGRGAAINPSDSQRARGTANLGHAFDLNYTTSDLTRYGHVVAGKMFLFSVDLNIRGDDVKILLEADNHAYEIYMPRSTYLLLVGGPGVGKSERINRIAACFPKGWFSDTGSGSEKSDSNGGYDNNCGRVCVCDEIPKDFDDVAGRSDYKKMATEQR